MTQLTGRTAPIRVVRYAWIHTTHKCSTHRWHLVQHHCTAVSLTMSQNATVLNGCCWLCAGHGGKPFGHAEIRLPSLIAKLDGEAVSEPHVAEAMEVQGVCAPLLTELGNEVLCLHVMHA